ncbi:hypothetical protein BTVI_143821 [Pitangus sulphuratus]|nr:hypothetical protein BTVI_143821 [Pitangus sulphuratus]
MKEWEMKEWGVGSLQEGLDILGVMKGEIMMPRAVMGIEESFTASMDVLQSSAVPLCPQDPIPNSFVTKENRSLVAVRCVMCRGPEGDKFPKKAQIHTLKGIKAGILKIVAENEFKHILIAGLDPTPSLTMLHGLNLQGTKYPDLGSVVKIFGLHSSSALIKDRWGFEKLV